MGKQHLRRVSEVIGPHWWVLPLSQTVIVTFASYLTNRLMVCSFLTPLFGLVTLPVVGGIVLVNG